MVKHDENKDIALLKRKGVRIEPLRDPKGKTRLRLVVPRNTLGIKAWGRIDYLVKVHNAFWTFSKTKVVTGLSDEKKSYRDVKKENKQHKLSDKTKKSKKK